MDGDGSGANRAEARRLYEEGRVPVAQIRQRFALSIWQFRKWRETDGWRPRPRVATPGVRSPFHVGAVATLLLRARGLAERQIAALEERERQNGRLTEEDMRGLAWVTQTLEHLMNAGRKPTTRLKKKATAASDREKKNNNAGRERDDDLEWLRAELRRRLAATR